MNPSLKEKIWLGSALLLAFSSMCANAQLSPTSATQQWVEDVSGRNAETQTYLGKDFSSKAGKFAATPESILDQIQFVEGKFLLGSYRFKSTKPSKEMGIVFDEKIVTDVLDCQKKYYGTYQTEYRLKGKTVDTKTVADRDISMIQTNGINIGSKLCELNAGKTPQAAPKSGVNNPSYNPKPTEKDMDKLIDKYAPKKSGGQP